jgi:hypothetical protein
MLVVDTVQLGASLAFEDHGHVYRVPPVGACSGLPPFPVVTYQDRYR